VQDRLDAAATVIVSLAAANAARRRQAANATDLGHGTAPKRQS
jgi:hypothetical protein